MKKYLVVVIGLAVLAASVSSAGAEHRRSHARQKATNCSTVADISTAHGVLYKDSNLHGGRGLTALYQNSAERTGTSTVQLRTVNGCKLIGTLGLYRCDFPYGCRYYAAYGSYPTKTKIKSMARADGSQYFLLQRKGGRWWKILANASRAGQVNK